MLLDDEGSRKDSVDLAESTHTVSKMGEGRKDKINRINEQVKYFRERINQHKNNIRAISPKA